MPAEERTYAARDGRAEPRVTLSEGDKVAFARNDYRVGVRNGWTGEVVGIAHETGTVTVRLADHVRTDRAGETIRQPVTVVRLDAAKQTVIGSEAARYVAVPARDVAHALSLDYARTADRSQGLTVDHAAVVAHADSRRLDKQWAAVAFTRQRETISVRLSAEGLERPERRQAIYEAAHWPRPRVDGRDGARGPNPLGKAREARDQARAAVREARDAWRQARSELRQARQDHRDAQATGETHLTDAVRQELRNARQQERKAHHRYGEAKAAVREATQTAREAWWEARAAARRTPEQVRGEERHEAATRAAKALDRDRPGVSTCDYPGAERALENARRERDGGPERAPERRPTPYEHRHEHPQEPVMVRSC